MRRWIVTVVMLASCKHAKTPADNAPKAPLAVPSVSVATVLAKETPAPPALLLVDDSDQVRLAAASTWADLDAKKLTIAKEPGPLDELDKYIREESYMGKPPIEAVKSWDKNGKDAIGLSSLEDTKGHASEDDPPPPPEEEDPTDNDESGGTGTAMALDEGKMGKKDSDRAEGQYRMQKYQDDPQLARQQAIDAAKNAGILGARALGGGGGAFASLGDDHHLNADGSPSRQAEIAGTVMPDGSLQALRTLVLIAPTAKATKLISVVSVTGGAIAVVQNGKIRPLNLDFTLRDTPDWTESEHWREVRVGMKSLVVEAVPDKPLEVGKLEELGAAIKTATDARGADPDAPVDVLVDADVDAQRMVDVVVALEVAGVHSIGAGAMPSADEMARRGKRIPTMSIGQPNAQGDLEKKEIRKVVKGGAPKIKACYERALGDQPGLRGTINTQFFISPDGTVAMANASGVDPNVANCVADVVKTLVFPKPKGGGGVQVNYPFTFRP